MCEICDGKTWEEYYLDLERKIHDYGWVLQYVEGTDDRNPDFGYTVGLTLRSHPEIIVFGMHRQCAYAAVVPIAEAVLGGRRFREGDDLGDLYPGAPPPELLDFPDSSTHLIRANELFRGPRGKPLPALQLFWPSEEPLLRTLSALVPGQAVRR